MHTFRKEDYYVIHQFMIYPKYTMKNVEEKCSVFLLISINTRNQNTRRSRLNKLLFIEFYGVFVSINKHT
jgi:hypothetical protein